MKRPITPVIVIVVAVATLAGMSQLASASRLPLTPKDVAVYKLVTGQPKVLQVTATEDTWNDDQNRNTTHGNDTRLGIADASGTACFILGSASCTTIKNARTYLKFDLTALPSAATVSSATLRLSGGPTTIGASPATSRRITNSWNEATMVYNSRPSTSGTVVTTGTATNQSGTMVMTFNVTTDLQNRVTSSLTNGWELQPNSTDSWWYSSEWATASQRPTLTVLYS